jgi:hypothetical protein
MTFAEAVQALDGGSRAGILAPDGRDIVSMNVYRPDPGMIKAVARGHKFLETLNANSKLSTHALAEAEKLDQSYVAKFVRMTQLAPDIIEAILNGRQPKTMSLARLQRTFPNAWTDQRKHFGFGGLQT